MCAHYALDLPASSACDRVMRYGDDALILWVPKTCVTWADALESAVPCPVPGEPVSGRPDVR